MATPCCATSSQARDEDDVHTPRSDQPPVRQARDLLRRDGRPHAPGDGGQGGAGAARRDPHGPAREDRIGLRDRRRRFGDARVLDQGRRGGGRAPRGYLRDRRGQSPHPPKLHPPGGSGPPRGGARRPTPPGPPAPPTRAPPPFSRAPGGPPPPPPPQR